MTAAEIVAELESLMRPDNDREGFYTTRELKKLLGLRNDGPVHDRLHVARDAGRLELRWFVEDNLLGRPTRKPAYRILPG